jgi:ATP-dependent DNA helicase RecG
MDSDPTNNHIRYARGVGPQRVKLFTRLGIKTIIDALYYLPYRYEDRSNLKTISQISPGEMETIRGRIVSSDVVSVRGGKFKIFEITVNDGTELLQGKWFNQPFMKKVLRVGQEVILSGVVKRDPYSRGSIEIDNPEFELVSAEKDSFIHTNRVVPVYRVTEGISQKQFRKIMFDIVNSYVNEIHDPMPHEITQRNNLPPVNTSLKQVHFPDESTPVQLLDDFKSNYQRKLLFDELFLFELALATIKKNSRREKGIAFAGSGRIQQQLLMRLPFRLTNAQKRSVEEIAQDMRKPYPMHRLIQGDVGCGKTIVALLSMLFAVEFGYQTALMAPTEILAEQHYFNICEMIKDLGLNSLLLTGSMRNRQLDSISEGHIDVIVGTHALIQEGVTFKRLGLAVIDEQHKFGVVQRARLRKKGINPDILVLTATPIPRSLSLTIYGDLDCSIIDELPPNRKRVVTKLFNAEQKTEIYRLLYGEIKKGKQAYVVYPAIEESDKADLKTAVHGKTAFEKNFPEFKIELVHGRMNAEEREIIMTSFKNGEIDILVCTTVIEVGVDVPNATVMLIIHAERFGLAQLHQLRGRVGRGADRSFCLLITYGSPGEEARRRLDIMVKSNDGFKIAEEDLKIRGPGEFLGTLQAGVPELRIADIVRDINILESAKREAFALIEISPELEEFPSLKKSLELFCKEKGDFYRSG